ncbi:MAG: hypothetical protein IPL79_06375 [Myxococcales bacterium]|nr:hypothetical protein [Myxococcales bacterium]
MTSFRLRLAGLLTWFSVAACGASGHDDLVPRAVPVPDLAPGQSPMRDGVTLHPSQRVATYAIDARLDPSTHRLTATEVVVFENRGTSDLTEVPFHLYLNAFKNEASVFMQEAAAHGTPFAPTQWGWIEVSSIRIDGGEHRAAARFVGPDETVLSLTLPEPVPPGGMLTMELDFVAQLPEAMARTGFVDAFHLVAQWYPKLGKRLLADTGDRWHCPPFHRNAEFFADFASYDVTLHVPSTYRVFATGMLAQALVDGGEHKLRFVADMVHDFAWVADPWLEETLGHATVEGKQVLVRVVHRGPQAPFAARHLRAAIGTIEVLSRELYPYPWASMTVVDPPPAMSAIAGMEYPTFVTTAGDSPFRSAACASPNLSRSTRWRTIGSAGSSRPTKRRRRGLTKALMIGSTPL